VDIGQSEATAYRRALSAAGPESWGVQLNLASYRTAFVPPQGLPPVLTKTGVHEKTQYRWFSPTAEELPKAMATIDKVPTDSGAIAEPLILDNVIFEDCRFVMPQTNRGKSLIADP
jgi:hypothetical protein